MSEIESRLYDKFNVTVTEVKVLLADSGNHSNCITLLLPDITVGYCTISDTTLSSPGPQITCIFLKITVGLGRHRKFIYFRS